MINCQNIINHFLSLMGDKDFSVIATQFGAYCLQRSIYILVSSFECSLIIHLYFIVEKKTNYILRQFSLTFLFFNLIFLSFKK